MASGLDAIGVAASIIQLADFGAQLSIKLYTFYHQVKNADDRLNSLSSNISLTCMVLKQLGETLKQDEQARLYSHEAFNTAKQVSVDCDAIFKKIDDALDHLKAGLDKNPLQRAAARVGFVFMENDINMLRNNLEQLKTTMLLLLNVIMYAGQIRSRAASKVLQDQSELINSLVTKTRVIQNPINKLFDHNDPLSYTISDEFKSYCSLIERVLYEMSAIQASLEQNQYWRVRNGVLKLHSNEITQCELAYGKDISQFLRGGLKRFCSQFCTGPEDPYSLVARSPLDIFHISDTHAPVSFESDAAKKDADEGTSQDCSMESLYGPDDVPRSPELETSKIDYRPMESPPPFLAVFASDTAKKGVDEGTSQDCSYQNRPDIAEFERIHPLSENFGHDDGFDSPKKHQLKPAPSDLNEKAQSALELLLHREPSKPDEGSPEPASPALKASERPSTNKPFKKFPPTDDRDPIKREPDTPQTCQIPINPPTQDNKSPLERFVIPASEAPAPDLLPALHLPDKSHTLPSLQTALGQNALALPSVSKDPARPAGSSSFSLSPVTATSPPGLRSEPVWEQQRAPKFDTQVPPLKRKRESSEDYSAGNNISKEDTQFQDIQITAKAARRAEKGGMSNFESIVLAWTTLEKHELSDAMMT